MKSLQIKYMIGLDDPVTRTISVASSATDAQLYAFAVQYVLLISDATLISVIKIDSTELEE